MSRLQDGSRKITHITEVLGFDIAKQAYLLQDLYVRRYSGMTRDNRIRSRLVPTGVLPACRSQLEEHGMTLPAEMLKCAALASKSNGVEDAAQ